MLRFRRGVGMKPLVELGLEGGILGISRGIQSSIELGLTLFLVSAVGKPV